MATHPKKIAAADRLRKVPTGIVGLDEITEGGLPYGRPTLICGSAGCGKSLFGAEFLVRGILQYDEPGVLMTFEEGAEDIRKNVSSLGFNIADLVARGKLVVDHVRLNRAEIEENGEYDLEGLFIRLDYAVRKTKARRVVLDTIEALFSGLGNQAILRSELRRLFSWLKERNLTAIITAERGEGALTRHGLEEYVSDCVILLDHRVDGQVSTRRLRVVKYRGSTHGTNEYPFLIDETGISVLPLTSSRLEYEVSDERVPTGVPELDEMLGGKGLFRGSTVMISGTAGTGKSNFAACIANETCRRGERCLYFSFEESQAQLLRNTKSIGLDLSRHVRRNLLQFHSTRPTVHGMEMHLVRMHKLVDEFKPQLVILDPISNLSSAGTESESTQMLIRTIDFLRTRGITTYFISLTAAGSNSESTEEEMSSLVDTWLLVRDMEYAGERSRALHVLKSRGMAHSNQVREFVITSRGLKLIPAYLGPTGVIFTGSARVTAEAKDAADRAAAAEEIASQELALVHRCRTVEAQIASLHAQLEADRKEFERTVQNRRRIEDEIKQARQAMAQSRHAGSSNSKSEGPSS